MEKEKIKLEEVIDLLPKKVYLCEIDYRDSFDENHELMQKCIDENDLYPLEDACEFWDCEYDSMDYYAKELAKDLVREFDVEDDEADEIVEEFREKINDELRERNQSDPISDMLRNTSDPVMFYDTGEEFDGFGNTAAQYRLDRMRIKKLLGIKDSVHDHDIEQMLYQASYGGKLVVYFRQPITDFIGKDDCNMIEFRDPAIAIVDWWNGSGDHCHLSKVRFSLPFVRDNLVIDKTIKYNYTYAVCGMSSDWCDPSSAELVRMDIPNEVTVRVSEINDHKIQEAKYNEVFQSGKCSLGDMDISRHRNTKYINDFPCGTHCMDCGTFWID